MALAGDAYKTKTRKRMQMRAEREEESRRAGIFCAADIAVLSVGFWCDQKDGMQRTVEEERRRRRAS